VPKEGGREENMKKGRAKETEADLLAKFSLLAGKYDGK
jgi:hypothetical protein